MNNTNDRDTECTRSLCCKCRVCLIGKAVLLLLIGAAIGYFVGKKCAMSEMHAKSAQVGALVGEQAGLVVITGAKDVTQVNSGWGTTQVSYTDARKFPAAEALSELSGKLKASGWTELKEDAFNPGKPSGQGWTTFGDRDGKEVRQWMADWKDSNGNVVRYELTYTFPANSRELGPLNVVGIFTPAALYQKQLEEIRKDKAAAGH